MLVHKGWTQICFSLRVCMPSSSFHDMIEQACQVLALSFRNLLMSKSKRVILFNISSETKQRNHRIAKGRVEKNILLNSISSECKQLNHINTEVEQKYLQPNFSCISLHLFLFQICFSQCFRNQCRVAIPP
jgi:hypothetical protein